MTEKRTPYLIKLEAPQKHWFFVKQEQLLNLIQEKLQELTQAEQEQVLSFIDKLQESRKHEHL